MSRSAQVIHNGTYPQWLRLGFQLPAVPQCLPAALVANLLGLVIPQQAARRSQAIRLAVWMAEVRATGEWEYDCPTSTLTNHAD